MTGVRTWVGLGTDHPCHVCGDVIHDRQFEHEIVDSDGPLLLHARCLHIWHQESLTSSGPVRLSNVVQVLDLIMNRAICSGCIQVKLATPASEGRLTILEASERHEMHESRLVRPTLPSMLADTYPCGGPECRPESMPHPRGSSGVVSRSGCGCDGTRESGVAPAI